MSTIPVEIAVEPLPCCPVCGGKGELLYQRQSDRLFGSPGEWGLRGCLSSDCGLIWLDPKPSTEDIPKLYNTYYTHGKLESQPNQSRLQKWGSCYQKSKLGYWSRRYGYEPGGPVSVSDRFSSFVFALLPNRRAALDYPFKWLSSHNRGNVLEIGCGSGDMLVRLKKWGWNVTGIEPDVKAAELARQRGVFVLCADLRGSGLTEDSFDAIIMHHVFEHIDNPVDTLERCKILLRSNGILLISTPNSDSLGHRLYREYWRGLEVPRHLMIYGIRAMRRVAALVDMDGAIVFSHGRGGIDVLKQSYCLKSYGDASHALGLIPRIWIEGLWFMEWLLNIFSKEEKWGEELVLVWRKGT